MGQGRACRGRLWIGGSRALSRDHRTAAPAPCERAGGDRRGPQGADRRLRCRGRGIRAHEVRRATVRGRTGRTGGDRGVMKRGDRITLDKLRRLALRWCPPEARWDSLIARTRRRSWGPAHELGHALIEPVERWSMPDYGRCSTGFCRCVGGECDVVERAAMLISSRLVAYAGYPDLAIDERTSTDGYDLIASPYYERRAKRMLVKLGLWPVPYTMSRLTSALARRETLALQHDRRDTAHELDITNATLARQPASRDTHPGGSKTLARQPASRDRSPPTSRSLGSLPADANTKCIRTCDAAVL